MVSVYVKELEKHTFENLADKLGCSENEDRAIKIISLLRDYNVLKIVDIKKADKDLSELNDESVLATSFATNKNKYYYVFPIVGVITVLGVVLKCYPKYISKDVNDDEFKQVLRVVKKYEYSKKQGINMNSDVEDVEVFNLVATILFFLNDYYENGLYVNTQEIIEINGSGDILWDKTINETFTLISNNRPYYPELLTKKRVNDELDFFKRVHECVLTECSNKFKSAGLLDLFDILGVELSDEKLEDIGENEYILDRITKELNVQFNTRKRIVLKAIYNYILEKKNIDDIECVTTFVTTSFNLVWEKVCKKVLSNKLETPMKELVLPIPLNNKYDGNKTLASIIEKPKWYVVEENKDFEADTLEPDLISIETKDGVCDFVIFDAKYYVINTNSYNKISGQPGIESVTKQYFYQLAYKNFIEDHKITKVSNCFLIPTEEDKIAKLGHVSMEMFNFSGMDKIEVYKLPAKLMYDNYLKGNKIKIAELKKE